MLLTQLIDRLQPLSVSGEVADRTVGGITFDSREVREGYLFVAIRGTRVDGHDYLEQAIRGGATAVVVSVGAEVPSLEGVCRITVEDSAVALAELAAAWFGDPSRELQLVGVTGTNGKTTVATLLYDLFTALGYRAGLLSTVEIRVAGRVRSATHTTPDPLAINAALAEMRAAGVDYVFMEVSSHAVHQHRTRALAFAGGVFTNLSHDHLDYHGTFADYLAAKKAFFDGLPAGAFALVNHDDKRGGVMVQNTRAQIRRYSLRATVDFHARLLANTPQGLQLEINGTEVFCRLLGRFNAYNLLAVYGAAVLLDQRPEEVLVHLSALGAPAGRLEAVADPGGRIAALVDYAHTPDALASVLTTLRGVLPAGGRLLCVVGAGGDRDRAKRPEMARIAARMSDQLILTSDNPRSENPLQILADMEAGLDEELTARSLTVADRRSAIRLAVRLARPHDILLVAGKGHETYQEIGGQRLPFDDCEELANALNEAARVS